MKKTGWFSQVRLKGYRRRYDYVVLNAQYIARVYLLELSHHFRKVRAPFAAVKGPGVVDEDDMLLDRMSTDLLERDEDRVFDDPLSGSPAAVMAVEPEDGRLLVPGKYGRQLAYAVPVPYADIGVALEPCARLPVILVGDLYRYHAAEDRLHRRHRITLVSAGFDENLRPRLRDARFYRQHLHRLRRKRILPAHQRPRVAAFFARLVISPLKGPEDPFFFGHIRPS
jgi:hypothetical protein